MTENTQKTDTDKAFEAMQKKLQKMLKDLPLDDEEHGCGSGCNHHHHHGQRD